ncbi:MAG: large subunit ribosomal protein [Pseudonocardiales bacterium]|jgi:large subunit ribosomal protein L24|nr:ribosomal protein [Frankiales bacterium]MDQ1691363.1 large subunit ribosomal protein [Pseudonocardiales bacterium]MDQ1733847.1 large subunit ribosomal protein [Pseudonocardiales bacterium]
MKIKKGDEVVVIAGKDRGKTGKVLASFPTENKVIVEGVNRVTKHTAVAANARGAKTGGIVTQEAKIDVSNLMIVEDGKATRVGYRRDEETGRNVRVSRRTGKDL